MHDDWPSNALAVLAKVHSFPGNVADTLKSAKTAEVAVGAVAIAEVVGPSAVLEIAIVGVVGPIAVLEIAVVGVVGPIAVFADVVAVAYSVVVSSSSPVSS